MLSLYASLLWRFMHSVTGIRELFDERNREEEQRIFVVRPVLLPARDPHLIGLPYVPICWQAKGHRPRSLSTGLSFLLASRRSGS
jgi:hypothetical protein